MAIQTSYSYQHVQATLDGLDVVGLMPGDDSVMVERNSDIGEMIIGADGSSLFNHSTDRAARITLRLMPTSPTHAEMMRKLRRQRDLGAIGTAFPFDLVEIQTNEGGSAERCWIAVAPSVSLGENATVREWVIVTGEWVDKIPVEVT